MLSRVGQIVIMGLPSASTLASIRQLILLVVVSKKFQVTGLDNLLGRSQAGQSTTSGTTLHICLKFLALLLVSLTF